MTESTAPSVSGRAKGKKKRAEDPSVIIRPWPKVVFLYPTLVVALICWFAQLLSTPEEGQVGSAIFGNLFLTVFFLNLLVFSFDFSRIKSITILVIVVAIVLGIGWADSTWNIAGGIKDVLGKIEIRMNTQFYGFVSAFLIAVMLLVLINTRFNYYEVNHREILHHHGYLGDITRMPTTGLRLNKEIYDLLEFALLKSGRLIFYPSTSREAIVIDNVLNVNRIENRIKGLLSVVAVHLHDEEASVEEL